MIDKLGGDPIKNLTNDAEDNINQKGNEQWLVRHNDKIIGLYESRDSANEAMNGYEMKNDINIDDELNIMQVI